MLLKDWNKNTPFVLNFHITKRCNMKCVFCFGGFKEIHFKKNKEDWINLIRKIAKETLFLKNKRINFAGGEPLLVPYLKDLIKVAKEEGFKTSIITNGSLLTETFLDDIKNYIDMIGISIDSVDNDTNEISGRTTNKGVLTLNDYIQRCNWISDRGITLKVNTVINKYNYNQDMSDLFNNTHINRWKILRMLKIENENGSYDYLCPTDNEFNEFVEKHLEFNPVIEDNADMTSTYLFVSPNGELMDNSSGSMFIAASLFDTTLAKAFEKIPFNFNAFAKRYDSL